MPSAPVSSGVVSGGGVVLRVGGVHRPRSVDRRPRPDDLARSARHAARRRQGRGAPAHHGPSRIPPGRRVVTVVVRLGVRARPVDVASASPSVPVDRGRPQRHLAPAAPGRRTLGPTYIKLGQIISSRRRAVPARARRRVQEVPRPGARRAVRRRAATVEEDLGSPPRGRVRVVRPHTAGGGVDRPGARGTAAHRRGRRRQGAAARRSIVSCAHDLRVDGVARAAPRRPHPGRRAGQPAGAGRAVRRDDRRGARLPHRSGEHARHRHRAARPRPGRLRRAPPASPARHPPGAGDGAALRVQLRRRRRHARTPASTPRP